MMKYIFDDEEIENRFSPGQIERYIKENNFTRLECLFYLWGFNDFHTNSDEVSTDLGRPMYRKLARHLGDLFKLCCSRINVAKPNSQHSEPNCNILLKNPDASEGNVKGDNR